MLFLRKNFCLLTLTLFTLISFGQELEVQLITGKVFSTDTIEIADIHILNLTQKNATITNKQGMFSINAKIGDTLLLSSIQLKKKIIVDTRILDQKVTEILITENAIRLREVIVTPNNLSGRLKKDVENLKLSKLPSAASSGIPNANVKRKTQNQRKWYTARTWDFTLTSIKLDPIINAISGRTARMKKRVIQEKTDKKYKNIILTIGDSTVSKTLKIPGNQIQNFYFFCEADSAYDSIINLNSSWEIWKFMKTKSRQFRTLNNLERN